MGDVEEEARLLVERVRINPVRTQQRHLAFPLAVLDLETVQLGGQFRHLLVDLVARMQAALAVEGVEAEIADQRPGHEIEAERRQDSTCTSARDHCGKMRVRC